MIGNDVIDLVLAKKQSNWKRLGYLKKVFVASEISFIKASINPDDTVWELWSRKEAVYKVIIQKGGISGFYPFKIICLDYGLTNGKVQFENQQFYTRTVFSSDSVYSEAVVNPIDFSAIESISDYRLIIKQNGIPFIALEDKLFSASKTHHGRFEKIVFLNK